MYLQEFRNRSGKFDSLYGEWNENSWDVGSQKLQLTGVDVSGVQQRLTVKQQQQN